MGDMSHCLNWTPGSWGKGLTTPEGDIHTWNVNQVQGDPHHMVYVADEFKDGIYAQPAEYPSFQIDPNGKVFGGAIPHDINKLDPRLILDKKAWDFQSATQHQLGWSPGQFGKGLVHNGIVHTWGVGVNQDGSPAHSEYAEKSFGMNEDQFLNPTIFDTAFGMSPEGVLNVYDDNGWVAAQAETADPR